MPQNDTCAGELMFREKPVSGYAKPWWTFPWRPPRQEFGLALPKSAVTRAVRDQLLTPGDGMQASSRGLTWKWFNIDSMFRDSMPENGDECT